MSGQAHVELVAGAAQKGALGGATLAIGSGVWTWLDAHSTGLGVVFGFVGMCCAVVSTYINWRRSKRDE